uniref:Uncharacterized protein n=1 Tax=Glossina pallidipes TaxID=7398 RepID=A0A1B0A4Y8_GLOPL
MFIRYRLISVDIFDSYAHFYAVSIFQKSRNDNSSSTTRVKSSNDALLFRSSTQFDESAVILGNSAIEIVLVCKERKVPLNVPHHHHHRHEWRKRKLCSHFIAAFSPNFSSLSNSSMAKMHLHILTYNHFNDYLKDIYVYFQYTSRRCASNMLLELFSSKAQRPNLM